MFPLQLQTLALLGKPARDLTDAEALDLLLALHAAGEITLPDGVRRDAAGRVVSPVAGARVRVGTTMRGVTFGHANDNKRPAGGAEGFDAVADFTPTPSFAVVLYKLAMRLADNWRATTIVFDGIGAGRSPTDCHSHGRCIDFYGIVQSNGSALDVRRDWYLQPVFLPAALPPLVPRPQHALAAGSDDRWGNDVNTSYRLDTATDAGRFFADVYQFATEETRVAAGDAPAANFRSGLGLGVGGFIYHPDHPVIGNAVTYVPPGRRTHHDHMHFQLGNT